MTTTARRTRGVGSSTPRACRWPRVISAPDSVVGIAIAAGAGRRRGGERLGDVDDPPAAERDEPVAADRAEQVARDVVDEPGRHVCTAPAARATCGAARGARSVVSSV